MSRILISNADTVFSIGPTSPSWIQQMELRPAYIDAVAMVVEHSGIRLSILNRHPTADWTAKIGFADFGE
jgi:alpha-N-arabinofuranosidase